MALSVKTAGNVKPERALPIFEQWKQSLRSTGCTEITIKQKKKQSANVKSSRLSAHASGF